MDGIDQCFVIGGAPLCTALNSSWCRAMYTIVTPKEDIAQLEADVYCKDVLDKDKHYYTERETVETEKHSRISFYRHV